jgi:hypothetical protein
MAGDGLAALTPLLMSAVDYFETSIARHDA